MRKLEERVSILENKLDERVTPPEGDGRVTPPESRGTSVQIEVDDDDEHILQHVGHLNKNDVQKVLVLLAKKIFTDEELMKSSRTGKRTVKCKGDPRPPLDARKLETLERVVRNKTSISKKLFVSKFQNLQKVLRRKAKRRNERL